MTLGPKPQKVCRTSARGSGDRVQGLGSIGFRIFGLEGLGFIGFTGLGVHDRS